MLRDVEAFQLLLRRHPQRREHAHQLEQHEGDAAGPNQRGGDPIELDQDLLRITRHFFDNGKPIASVCHGVEIPAYAGCVQGRRMATVPKCKFDLEVCGGTFVNEPCLIDGNLISGRTFHDNGYYIGPWIELLEKARNEIGALT